MATVRELLAVAQGELGVTESPAGSNRTKYGKWMGLDGQPWCMSFVQWCFARAGTPLPYKTGSCSALLNWYRKHRLECVVTDPLPGDIAIFTFGHTGIVEGILPGAVLCIEGNTSSSQFGSQNNGGGVYRRERALYLVKAFIRPYPKKEDVMTGEQIYNELQAYLSTQQPPVWALKELAEAVQMGITDGSNPMGLIPRYQAAIMAKRAAQK